MTVITRAEYACANHVSQGYVTLLALRHVRRYVDPNAIEGNAMIEIFAMKV